MANIVAFNPSRAVDINSFAIPGALATFYDSGTSRVRTVYTDPDCTIPHPTPLSADGAGVFPAVYDAGQGDVKVTVTTASGVVLAGFPMDPVPIIGTDATGAAAVSFDPTEEIPETNVQAAIERVQANLVEPLAEFGLGVTGNATLLSDIDVTETASGFYRFDGTTAGTFPAGVTKSNGGIVAILRRTATGALMILQQSTSNRLYIRRLEAAWQGWVWAIESGDTVSNAVWEAGASTTPVAATPAGVMKAVKAQAIGADQTWQVLTRGVGNTYTNDTGRSIQVAIQKSGGSSDLFQVSNNDGVSWVTLARGDSNICAVIQAGGRYRVTAGTIIYWAELR